MAKVNFKYYLHGDATRSELREYLGSQVDPGLLTDDLMEKIGRPFYEVELDCVLDTETGAVTIIGTSG